MGLWFQLGFLPLSRLCISSIFARIPGSFDIRSVCFAMSAVGRHHVFHMNV